MPVRFVPNSMTLNDLEPNASFPNFSDFCQLSQFTTPIIMEVGYRLNKNVALNLYPGDTESP